MDFIDHVNKFWRFYSLLIAITGFALLWWLSKYFATKKELDAHAQNLELHKQDFKKHKADHYRLSDMVNKIDHHVQNLPTSQDSQALRETMARLEGRLESVEPMFKQILNQYNMLLENELRGEKK